MRFRVFPILLILISIPLYAQGEWVYNSDTLTLNTKIESEVTISALSNDFSVKRIEVNLSFFPKESDTQDILRIKTSPEGVIEKDSIIYTLENPAKGTHRFIVDADVISHNYFKMIEEKVDFPLKDLPNAYLRYIEPREKIDSSNLGIIDQASILATGEDDTIMILHKIGKWVNDNIEYRQTEDVVSTTKEASWVLLNRYGVCDEYSTLFIAMVRSLGIPARYISGVAYSNQHGINDWGPHGWAEVYIPVHGWIPYDPTYGQLGFVDASHVRLKESLDSGESAISYQWQYIDAGIRTQSLDIKTTVISRGNKIEPYVDLEIRAIRDKVGFGSYNLIELTIRNRMDHYVSTGLVLAETRELDNEDDMSTIILLKPREERKLYWTIKLVEDLNPRFLYTIPLYAQTTRNATAEAFFQSTSADPVYSREEMIDLRNAIEDRPVMNYKRELSFNCSPLKPIYHTYEPGQIRCIIKNQGNTMVSDLKVCMLDVCRMVDIGIGQNKAVNFDLDMNTGEKELVVRASNDDFLMQDIATVTILDVPAIEIFEKESPGDLSFGEFTSISAHLRKTSYSSPRELSVRFYLDDILLSEMHSSEVTINQKYQLELNTDMMPRRHNTITVIIDWKDLNGKNYQITDGFEININNLNLLQRAALLINRIELFIQSLF